MGGYGVPGVLGDEVRIDGGRGSNSGLGRTDDLRHEIGRVPGDPDTGDGGEAHPVSCGQLFLRRGYGYV